MQTIFSQLIVTATSKEAQASLLPLPPEPGADCATEMPQSGSGMGKAGKGEGFGVIFDDLVAFAEPEGVDEETRPDPPDMPGDPSDEKGLAEQGKPTAAEKGGHDLQQSVPPRPQNQADLVLEAVTQTDGGQGSGRGADGNGPTRMRDHDGSLVSPGEHQAPRGDVGEHTKLTQDLPVAARPTTSALPGQQMPEPGLAVQMPQPSIDKSELTTTVPQALQERASLGEKVVPQSSPDAEFLHDIGKFNALPAPASLSSHTPRHASSAEGQTVNMGRPARMPKLAATEPQPPPAFETPESIRMENGNTVAMPRRSEHAAQPFTPAWQVNPQVPLADREHPSKVLSVPDVDVPQSSARSTAETLMNTAQNRSIAKPDDVVVIQQVIRLKGTGPIAPNDPQVVNERSAASNLRTPLRADQTPAMTGPQPIVATSPLPRQISAAAVASLQAGHLDTPHLQKISLPGAAVPEVRQPARFDTAPTISVPQPFQPNAMTPSSHQAQPSLFSAAAAPVPSSLATPVAGAQMRRQGENLSPFPAQGRDQGRPTSKSSQNAAAPDQPPEPLKPTMIKAPFPGNAQNVGLSERVVAGFAQQNVERGVKSERFREQRVPVSMEGKPSQPPPPISQPVITGPLGKDVTKPVQPDRERTLPALSSPHSDALISSRSDPVATTTPQGQPQMARMDLPAHVARQIADVAQHMPSRPVEISLSPEELGRVRLSVSASEAGLTVTVLAERPETLDLMRRHIHSLEQEFQALGYEGVDFSFSDGQQPEDKPDQPFSASSNTDTHGMSTPDPEPGPTDRKPAINAGLDLRL